MVCVCLCDDTVRYRCFNIFNQFNFCSTESKYSHRLCIFSFYLTSRNDNDPSSLDDVLFIYISLNDHDACYGRPANDGFT